ncbi:sugar ABC transporter permease [Curvibacter sp. CHRR-16]|uniref:ABC transporter permease n=1 Tax=Curvibacter sp. CHRR-16 TaxID=2835872 RepID=UPI001BDA57CF|nr:ABC transporter permease subunit [Curvibacter sp. CHRR-16]MBT0569938.1 sugar ABC transporter permease [Curvibacter sp. CHRR-16]
MSTSSFTSSNTAGRPSKLRRELARHKWAYLMLAPVVLYFLIFHYVPMYGVVIAFKDYDPVAGVINSPWVGLEWFEEFFNSMYLQRLLVNTLMLNLYDLLFGFPAPIVLALMLNELTSMRFRQWVQTLVYLPHFISVVMIAGMMVDFLARDGVITQILMQLGANGEPLLRDPAWFRTIYVASEIWQAAGWGSIIYLASLAGINPTLYEAARVDGANRWHQLVHITLPSMLPVIMMMLIVRLGQMMTVGFEKILLLYNPSVYETADVISTFVYRRGILDANYSFAAAVGLFNSVIAMVLLIVANRISRRLTGNGLW